MQAALGNLLTQQRAALGEKSSASGGAMTKHCHSFSREVLQSPGCVAFLWLPFLLLPPEMLTASRSAQQKDLKRGQGKCACVDNPAAGELL